MLAGGVVEVHVRVLFCLVEVEVCVLFLLSFMNRGQVVQTDELVKGS